MFYILLIMTLITSPIFAQEEYETSLVEEIDEVKEDPIDNKSTNPTQVEESRSEVVNDIPDSQVLDLSKIDFEQKEKEWNSRIEAEGDDSDISILDEIIENTDDYTYSGYKRPDPFSEPSEEQLKKAFLIQEARFTESPNTVVDEKGKEIAIKSILQSFRISELNVKGIWVGSDGASKAMIMTPNSEGVIVKVNDPISAGKVLQIYPDRVLVRQYKYQEDGTRIYDDVNIYLRAPKLIENGSIVFNAGKGVEFKKGRTYTETLKDVHLIEAPEVEEVEDGRKVMFEGDLQPSEYEVKDIAPKKTEGNTTEIPQNRIYTQDVIEPVVANGAENINDNPGVQNQIQIPKNNDPGVMGDGDKPADQLVK